LKGNERELGLAVLTMSEMLSMAEERGDAIFVSVYEVSQETVYDLLDQEKRVVSVLEGAQGKIQLKGLSQASYLVFLIIKFCNIIRIFQIRIINISMFLLSGTCEVTLRIPELIFWFQEIPEADQ